MTEPRAVIDVVRSEAGANELLKEIRLLVRSLRRAEARERLGTLRVADALQRAAGERKRLFPARFAKHRQRIRRIDGEVRALRHAGLADQRLGEPMRMRGVVEAEAAFDAQPALVCDAVTAFDP